MDALPLRARVVNQRGKVGIEYVRTLTVPRRGAPPTRSAVGVGEWGVR